MALLIVDDEESNRDMLSRRLQRHGFEVVMAEDGHQALDSIRQQTPDVVLLDIRMPGMSGLELLPKAKAIRPDVPIIMITAYGDAETKRQALENGAEALLTKPIDFGTLRSEIDSRVERAA